MKIYDYHEIDELPQGEWIECCDGLPPPGKEVIVETTKGKVTALACFIDYEGAPPERGRWDNQYPGKGNCHLMDSIVRWQPMPRPKTPNVRRNRRDAASSRRVRVDGGVGAQREGNE